MSWHYSEKKYFRQKKLNLIWNKQTNFNEFCYLSPPKVWKILNLHLANPSPEIGPPRPDKNDIMNNEMLVQNC